MTLGRPVMQERAQGSYGLPADFRHIIATVLVAREPGEPEQSGEQHEQHCRRHRGYASDRKPQRRQEITLAWLAA